MKRQRMSEAVHQYLGERQRKSQDVNQNTLAADNNCLNMFVRMTSDLYLDKITKHHVYNFFYGPGGLMDDHVILSKRTRRGTTKAPPVAPATHNHYRSRLTTFFKWCRAHDLMRDDVMVLTEPLTVPQQRRRRPTVDQMLRLLDAADNARDRAYLATAMNTALRSSEIYSLKIMHLDLENGVLLVKIHKSKKTDEQPITSDLDVELRRWLVEYAENIGRPLRPEDYLFPRRRGGLISHYMYEDENGKRYHPLTLTAPDRKRMTPVCMRSPYVWVPDIPIKETHLIVKKALRNIGWTEEELKKEGTHTIRRGIARIYFDMAKADGGDISALRETAKLLHHTNTATTERYLGDDVETRMRNERLKGKPFLSTLIDKENVTEIEKVRRRRKAEGE